MASPPSPWQRPLLKNALGQVLGVMAPHQRVPSVLHLTPKELLERGLRGVLFDIDDTLGCWGFDCFEEPVLAHLIAMKRGGLEIAFLSNHDGSGRRRLETSLEGLPVIWDAKKPRGHGFSRALGALGLHPREAAMVGDRLFIDVWGAKRLGLFTILVDPVIGVDADESLALRTARLIEKTIVFAHAQCLGPDEQRSR